MSRWLSAGLLALAATGCSVDREFLDTELFECTVSSECGEGWGCVEATPYAVDFCAPLPDDCDATCDGVCTGGEEAFCLRPCRLADDGTPSGCASEGFRCVRTSIERNDGLCYPIATCRDDADCGAGEVCLSEYLRELNPDNPQPFDNLYCVPRADDAGAGCPGGSSTRPFWEPTSGDIPICYPNCTVTDTRCPPAMGCLTQLQQLSAVPGIDGPQCALGNYGLSCDDDSNCFVGKCLDIGGAQGKICTVTCAEASRLAGGAGCEALIYPFSLQGLFAQLECDSALPSDDGSGLCALRYRIQFPSCTQPGEAYPCASGLDCRRFFNEEGSFTFCTRDCELAADCNGGLPPDQWLYECNSGVCTLPQGG